MLRLNGDLFWEEKFHGANGKTQACTQGALLLFSFEVLGGTGEGMFFAFPWFTMCSHYVHLKFPIGSHQVPNMFLNMFSIAPHDYHILNGFFLLKCGFLKFI
jgi:hypothetical protein